jgi:hypothetical protein
MSEPSEKAMRAMQRRIAAWDAQTSAKREAQDNAAYRCTDADGPLNSWTQERSILVGPDGFTCTLDKGYKSWFTDGEAVVAELNRLHDRVVELEANVKLQTLLNKYMGGGW